jgi:hypothetical protein
VVVMNQATKELIIIDVAVTFENRYEAFQRSRQEKIDKYTPIAENFRSRGWSVNLNAVVVGALGSWDPANETALKMLRISPRYAKLMRKFIVSDTIRWSRDMYVEHLTGKQQYQTPHPPQPATQDQNIINPIPEQAINHQPADNELANTHQQAATVPANPVQPNGNVLANFFHLGENVPVNFHQSAGNLLDNPSRPAPSAPDPIQPLNGARLTQQRSSPSN